MTESADHIPVDQEIVGNIAGLLVQAPIDKVGGLLEKVLQQLYFGARAKGWQHEPAIEHAEKFVRSITAAIEAIAERRQGARLH